MSYKLDTRIVIEKFSHKEREQESKELVDVWESYFPCWAGFKAMSGKKFAEQHGTNYQRLDNIVVRYSKDTAQLLDISTLGDYRINIKGQLYTIKYPYNIKNQNTYISLECELIG